MERVDTPNPKHSLSEQLIHELQRPIDTRTRRRAIWHWLDWIACVAAGSRAPVAKALRDWQPLAGFSPKLSTPPALLWPSLAGSARSDMQAIWLDAGLANVEEMDDMHRGGILHPGPVVLPVVAHLARHTGLSAGAALDAVVRGYEATIRVGRSVGPAHYARWHNTATAGVFGAAIAAADAIGLSEEEAVWAFGNAGTQASGLWQARIEPVMTKQLHTAHAAWAGLTAATLARAGFTGPRFILEGEKGFFQAMCADAEPEMVLSPSSDWLLHETSFKPWPSCRHTHPTIDCVLAIRQSLGDASFSFNEALVESFNDAITICDTPLPTSRTEAKFSLQYCVAATARWGRLLPEHFDEAAWVDPEMRAATSRVRLRPDTVLTNAYPAHFGARVTVVLKNGEHHFASVVDAFGDPERPLDEDDLLHKARMLMRYGGVSEARSRAVTHATRDLMAMIEADPERPMPRALLDPLF